MLEMTVSTSFNMNGARKNKKRQDEQSQPTNTSVHRARARAETTKRLLAQLVNEQLVTLKVLHDVHAHSGTLQARMAGKDSTNQWIICPVADSIILSDHVRPDDFGVPVTLCSNADEILENDPGAVFEFSSAWFDCADKTRNSIVEELRNSALMLEKWMELGADMPILDLNSSFLGWERAVVTGHPTHPFHRTCFASNLLDPVTPQDLERMLNPSISFISTPRSSICIFGPFEELIDALAKHLAVSVPNNEAMAIVPCLTQHLPALTHFFPEATLIKTVPNCGVAQAAIRTVSILGVAYDIKFSLACLITSALRVLPSWSAASAPRMTSLLKTLVPPDLWLCGEVAAVTGSQEDTSEARYLTCILRENLEEKARENGEALIVVSALIEKPMQSDKTYAEILFDLETISDKIQWFKMYIECLLPLALDPLLRHGVGFEFHAQNAVVRVCKKTKTIKSFAIRDLAGIKMHRPTFVKQGFDLTDMDASATDDVHEVWDRVHHALLQNHIGYLMYALGLEKTHDGWGVVRSFLFDVLTADGSLVGREMYEYFLKETMAFKCFLTMRMEATLKTSFKIVDIQIPNVCKTESPWLRQISVAGMQSGGRLSSPEQVTQEVRDRERALVLTNRSEIVPSPGQLTDAVRRRNPHPALLPKLFIERLELFHEALALALDSIIERWWKDSDANFPARMPLDPQTEDLLRWVDKGTIEGYGRPYKGHQGNLRPDFLIPAEKSCHDIPRFRICEINARFPISFLHYVASSYEALAGLGWDTPLIAPATDHKKLYDSLFELFDPKLPVHFVRETSDFPLDSPLFGLMEERTGIRPRSVVPASLRLIPSSTSPTGFVLYCVWGVDSTVGKRPANLKVVDGELLEEVHQVGLQLYDFELFSLDPEMVRQIAMRSVNDVRSIFIAHDKRILGIIRQDLYDLVHKHQVLTSAQAQMLEERLIPTILPGSAEVKALLQASSHYSATKDTFILKPFRRARGSGIVLGKDLSDSEWDSILKGMQETRIDKFSTQYILQPLLPLRKVHWFWNEERKVQKSRMVGTYFSINGQFKGFGAWRTALASEDVISAATTDITTVFAAIYLGDE
ncbi:hypothetical protein ONS95_002017 [Cadophora gregata]|uniref:uncharacterized protein n=1 Tax=Cadophora gregata TaxID=51156 RepID=UPI0026DD124D|nr:uncharacterized protein ONS95_002017 [Cadophora gregata]KAK0111672.1 hypothetical protein ONS95_002017 [Cadophora gregata]